MPLNLQPPPRPPRQVLAVEPNGVRASTLRNLLQDYADIHVKIVPDVKDAIQSLAGRIPDLVIASTFLPPSDEAALIADLKARPGASHVQVLIVPHFTSQDGATSDPPRGIRLLRRTSTEGTGFDFSTLRDQIVRHLDQPRIASSSTADMMASYASKPVAAHEPLVTTPDLHLVPRSDDARTLSAPDGLVQRFAEAVKTGRDRRRGPRLSIAELPWLWSAQLSTGAKLKLVDVSNTGVRVETAAKLALGTTVDLRLVGRGTDLVVPSQILRSTVSEVTPLGVTYHVAAAFSRELHLLEMPTTFSVATQAVVGAAVGPREEKSVTLCVDGSTARTRFEQELRRFLSARDVLIRQTPIVADDGADSVYFSIPGGSGSILQVIFERQHQPSAMEFEVLRAAARLAAAVLEVAPVTYGERAVAEALAG